MTQLTSHEIEVLEILAGEREGTWGAWVGACIDFLQGYGYCTRGPKCKITEAGRAALDEIKADRRAQQAVEGHDKQDEIFIGTVN